MMLLVVVEEEDDGDRMTTFLGLTLEEVVVEGLWLERPSPTLPIAGEGMCVVGAVVIIIIIAVVVVDSNVIRPPPHVAVPCPKEFPALNVVIPPSPPTTVVVASIFDEESIPLSISRRLLSRSLLFRFLSSSLSFIFFVVPFEVVEVGGRGLGPLLILLLLLLPPVTPMAKEEGGGGGGSS